MNLSSDCTVVISGATSGIGEATAKLLAQNNFRLILVGRREEKLIKLADALNTETYVMPMDIRDKNAVKQQLGSLTDNFSNIDCLINNAGVEIGSEPLDQKHEEDIQAIIDTNVAGTTNLTYQLLKRMKPRKSGHIINIGSIAAYTSYKGGNVYGGTKAYIRQFSRNLRVELIASGIKVTNIEPGSTKTELAIGINNFDLDKASKHYNSFNPLLPEDIANTILWAIKQPSHVNIDNIEILPLDQAPGGIVMNSN